MSGPDHERMALMLSVASLLSAQAVCSAETAKSFVTVAKAERDGVLATPRAAFEAEKLLRNAAATCQFDYDLKAELDRLFPSEGAA
jgi:hypothetical protein